MILLDSPAFMVHNRILVVEDDESAQELYRHFFDVACAGQFLWRLVSTGEEAIRFLDQEAFDLVVLDVGLPMMTGLDVLRWRQRQPAARVTPVLVVSAEAQVRDRVTALNLGADDYLAKKYDQTELLAKLHALLRRQNMALIKQGAYNLGWLKIDPLSRQVTVDGEPAHLEPKEFDLLAILARHPGMIHRSEDIWDMVRDEPNRNYRHIIDSDVSSLRRKLGKRAEDFLLSHKGLGYSLETRVRT